MTNYGGIIDVEVKSMSNEDKQQENIKSNENYSLINNNINEQFKSPLNDLKSTLDSYNTFKKISTYSNNSFNFLH